MRFLVKNILNYIEDGREERKKFLVKFHLFFAKIIKCEFGVKL